MTDNLGPGDRVMSLGNGVGKVITITKGYLGGPRRVMVKFDRQARPEWVDERELTKAKEDG